MDIKYDKGSSSASTLVSLPKIIVYSDYICPFCFIGNSRIDKLRKEFQGNIDVEWRNIEIHPKTPMNGIQRYKLDKRSYTQLWIRVENLAQESGIEIRPPPVLSNSSLALIASEYARVQGRIEAFHNAVFQAYWQEGKNIGDLGVLSAIAERVGISPSGLRAYFKEGNWEDSIERNQQSAAEHRVSGVPTFIIGKQKLEGAQPYDLIRNAFLEELTSNQKFQRNDQSPSNSMGGGICGDRGSSCSTMLVRRC